MRRAGLVLLLGTTTLLAHPFTKDDWHNTQRNRIAVQSQLGERWAVVFAQPFTDILLPRQEGDYLYLTGVREPGGVLVLSRKTSTLLLPALNPRTAQFYGQVYLPNDQTSRTLAIQTAPLRRSLATQLHALLPQGARLALPRYAGPDHAPVRERKRALVEGIRKLRPGIEIVDLDPVLLPTRSRKNEWERRFMGRAIEITEEAFRNAVEVIRPGGTEAQVEHRMLGAMRHAKSRPAFPTVVGAGRNAAIPHYFANDGPLPAGGLVVIDSGATWHRYAADITRTFPVSGRFTPAQRKLYDAVLEAQLAGIAAVRPGASFRDIHNAARNVLRKHGLDRHFIHGTSHHVGLDVHDPGPTDALAANMIITVEPGIYILEKELGIRIEDMVRVTKDGGEVLTAKLPKTADAIEKWMASIQSPAQSR
ncbi:MAG: Xaa-Pro peptidase family protein [Planctomycetota bacterium]